MKPLIKKLWITTLLSGKYKQGKGSLKKGQKFCCLGVLSDLYAKKHNAQWRKEDGNTFLFDESGVLPDKVKKWAGLSSHNPRVELTDKSKKKVHFRCTDGKESLSVLNDEGCNFKVIAECIDKSL